MKKVIPWIISLVFVLWAVMKMIPSKEPPGFDIDGFGRLPLLVGGRVMPMDTLARVSLFAINHQGTSATSDGTKESQSRWLLDVLMLPEHADVAKVFEVSNPDLLDLFGWQEAKGKPNNYSFNDLSPSWPRSKKKPD
jgi:hypothetical protein